NRAEPMFVSDSLEEMFYRSDQASFADRKIPVVFFSTGEHPDYHKVTDSPDKIDNVKLAHVARLCFRTAWIAADSPEHPAFLNVKQGDKFAYDVGFTMQMTQSMGGQDVTIEATSTADGLLAAGKATKGRIDWAYDLNNMHMKLNSAMLPGGGKDTTVQVPTQK